MASTKKQTAWVPTFTRATRLRMVRHELGLSQRQAAIRCGITFGEWQGLEVGRGVRHEVDKFDKIADALGVDREWLIRGTMPEGDSHDGGTVSSRVDPISWLVA